MTKTKLKQLPEPVFIPLHCIECNKYYGEMMLASNSLIIHRFQCSICLKIIKKKGLLES